MKTRRFIVIIFAIVLIGVLFVPFEERTVVPKWRIQIVEKSGLPIPNEMIGEAWLNYSLEFWRPTEHSDRGLTDEQGIVEFPERKLNISLIHLFLKSIRDQLSTLNSHASYGNFAYIYCVNRTGCRAFYSDGVEPTKTIVVEN